MTNISKIMERKYISIVDVVETDLNNEKISDKKINSIRKELLCLEMDETNNSNFDEKNYSNFVKIIIDTPILRNSVPSHMVRIAPITTPIPLKFFPTPTTKNSSPSVGTNSSPSVSPQLRKMSISTKKFAHVSLQIPSQIPTNTNSGVERKISNKSFLKPGKNDEVRRAIGKLKKFAINTRKKLENCLRKEHSNCYLDKIRLGSELGISVRSMGNYIAKSNSPEIKAKKRMEANFVNSNLISIETNKAKNVPGDRKMRRRTTLCHCSNMEGKFNLYAFEAIKELSLAPVIKQ